MTEGVDSIGIKLQIIVGRSPWECSVIPPSLPILDP